MECSIIAKIEKFKVFILLKVITSLNLQKKYRDEYKTDNISLRGYKSETFLSGEFIHNLIEEKIKPLSVSNIADRICPTRRDLYYAKGVNRSSSSNQITWTRRAGILVESFFELILSETLQRSTLSYDFIIESGDIFYKHFINQKSKLIEKLKKLEYPSTGNHSDDTNWLLLLLQQNGYHEFSFRNLHENIETSQSLNIANVKIKEKIKPDLYQIGINSPSEPDFLFPDFGIVGDIKTSDSFKQHYNLTCAGYALAYENATKKDINWGVIYFLPNRNPSDYVKNLTFTQVYIFPIDDPLRRWFLDFRDRAYTIISKGTPPKFPKKTDRQICVHCKYKDICINAGLKMI